MIMGASSDLSILIRRKSKRFDCDVTIQTRVARVTPVRLPQVPFAGSTNTMVAARSTHVNKRCLLRPPYLPFRFSFMSTPVISPAKKSY